MSLLAFIVVIGLFFVLCSGIGDTVIVASLIGLALFSLLLLATSGGGLGAALSGLK